MHSLWSKSTQMLVSLSLSESIDRQDTQAKIRDMPWQTSARLLCSNWGLTCGWASINQMSYLTLLTIGGRGPGDQNYFGNFNTCSVATHCFQMKKKPNILFLSCFSSFEFHEYLKLLRFQQVSCPESEVGLLPKLSKQLSHLLQTLLKSSSTDTKQLRCLWNTPWHAQKNHLLRVQYTTV